MAETIDAVVREPPPSLRRTLSAPLQRLWKRLQKSKLIAPIAVVIIATLVPPGAVHYIPFLLYVERFAQDIRTTVYMPAEKQDRNITIVAIDEDTLKQFPYSEPVDRGLLAQIIKMAVAHGARAIGLDVLLDAPTEPEKDDLLRSTLHDLKIPFIVSYVSNPEILDDPDYLNEFVPPQARAMANLGTDPFDIARWTLPGAAQPDGSYIPGFAPALAAKLGVTPPKEQVEIAWHGKPANGQGEAFLKLSAIHLQTLELAHRRLDPDWAAGKVVLIGSDNSLKDRHRTPFASVFEGNEGIIPGILIHAHSLSQLLDGRPSDSLPWSGNLLIGLVLAVIGFLLGRLDIQLMLRTGLAGAVVAVLVIGGFQLFHMYRVMIELVGPTLSLTIAAWTSDSLGHREARKQREYIKSEFSRYVSPKIVNQLIEDPRLLDLSRRTMTFIFTDVAGFTTLSEAVESAVLARVLNTYLEGVCQIIHKYDGTVDKFIGDAVFCIFNAPASQPDHRERAVNCAREIDEYAERFRAEQNAQGIPFGVTRIGVHSGEATAGNFGSNDKREYTALGDPVNTASRLEGLNKYLGTRVAVSEATKEGCGALKFRPIGDIILKGKAKATAVFEPLSEGTAASDYIKRYEQAYALLERRDPAALERFAALHEERPDDGAVDLHLERLRNGETGIEIVMTEK